MMDAKSAAPPVDATLHRVQAHVSLLKEDLGFPQDPTESPRLRSAAEALRHQQERERGTRNAISTDLSASTATSGSGSIILELADRIQKQPNERVDFAVDEFCATDVFGPRPSSLAAAVHAPPFSHGVFGCTLRCARGVGPRELAWSMEALAAMSDSIARHDGGMDNTLLTEGLSVDLLCRMLPGYALYETERNMGNVGADYSIFRQVRATAEAGRTVARQCTVVHKVSVTVLYPLLKIGTSTEARCSNLRWPPYPEYFAQQFAFRCGGCKQMLPRSVFWNGHHPTKSVSRSELAAMPEDQRRCKSCDAAAVVAVHRRLAMQPKKAMEKVRGAQELSPISDEELHAWLSWYVQAKKEAKLSNDYTTVVVPIEHAMEARGIHVTANVWMDWRNPRRRGNTVGLEGGDIFARMPGDTDCTPCQDCQRPGVPRIHWYMDQAPPASCDDCLQAKVRKEQQDRCRRLGFDHSTVVKRFGLFWTDEELRSHISRKLDQMPSGAEDYCKLILHIWVVDGVTQEHSMQVAADLLRQKIDQDVDGYMSNVIVLVTRIDGDPELHQALFVAPRPAPGSPSQHTKACAGAVQSTRNASEADEGLDAIRTRSAEERRRTADLDAIADAFSVEESIASVELAETREAISMARDQAELSRLVDGQQELHCDTLIGELWREEEGAE